MTAIPLVLKDLPPAAAGLALRTIAAADAVLSAAGPARIDHLDVQSRIMGRPRLAWRDGRGGTVRAWIEDHAFHHRIVAEGLWIEVEGGDGAQRIVEMVRKDRSNLVGRDTTAEAVRCILSQIATTLRQAADVDPDLWSRPPFENDVALLPHVDAATEAGFSTVAGMAAVVLDVMPEMSISLSTGAPYQSIDIHGIRDVDRDHLTDTERRLSPLVPAQIQMSRHEWDGIPTWQFGPRFVPERLHDVRLSAADALRIAGRLPR